MPAVIIETSAPGKLVLSGEYAVLEGAPAICMAVQRRARVTIEASNEDHHMVTAPGHSATTGRFRAGKEGLEWLEGGEDFVLLAQVWNSASVRPQGHWKITLDTSEFVHGESDRKIGIGSSAALSVALAEALVRAGGLEADGTGIALDAHSRFQDGMGSGADIACSASGGLIEYTMRDMATRPLGWPDGLAYGALWVGVPSSTRKRLAQLDKQKQHVSRAALVLASRRMAAAWAGDSARAVLDGYADYIDVLREFGIDHDLGIFDAGHAALTDAALESGIVYKPCGAGGGDVGIVLALEADAVTEFLGRAKEAGKHPVELRLDTNGVRTERESS